MKRDKNSKAVILALCHTATLNPPLIPKVKKEKKTLIPPPSPFPLSNDTLFRHKFI